MYHSKIMTRYTKEEVIKLIVNNHLNNRYSLKQSLTLMFIWIYTTHSNPNQLTKKKCVQYTLDRQTSFKRWLKSQSVYENM